MLYPSPIRCIPTHIFQNWEVVSTVNFDPLRDANAIFTPKREQASAESDQVFLLKEEAIAFSALLVLLSAVLFVLAAR